MALFQKTTSKCFADGSLMGNMRKTSYIPVKSIVTESANVVTESHLFALVLAVGCLLSLNIKLCTVLVSFSLTVMSKAITQ